MPEFTLESAAEFTSAAITKARTQSSPTPGSGSVLCRLLPHYVGQSVTDDDSKYLQGFRYMRALLPISRQVRLS